MYKSIEGDSWDLISYRVYGSEKYVPELMQANLEHVHTFIFKAGVELATPEIKVSKDRLLPWK